jgi:hypothetical protein
MLRQVVVFACVALALTAAAQLALGHPFGWLPVGLEAGLVAVLLVIERGRYRPRINPSAGTWKETGERFRDPVSGELVEVYADTRSGARDYRPVSSRRG